MALQDKLSTMTQTRQVGKLLADIAEILDKLEGINCYIERTGNRWKINALGVAAPATGTYVLTSIDGVIQWTEVQEFTCPE
jgi:hypothetical protein